MVAENNVILTDVDAPGRTGDVMGMYYDEAKQCWRLDYACRIDGKPTHLKATVFGAKRATQPAAMQKWLELREKAIKPEGSLKFGEATEKYLQENPNIENNVLATINYLKSSLGNVKFNNFRGVFEKWIAAESKRSVRRWKRVGAELKLCDTGKKLSVSTIRSYMRYAKIIARASGQGDAFDGITIGKSVVRRRALKPFEMLQLEEACNQLYPWFYPAFDFARCNPIRPEDQFTLTVGDHVDGNRIVYAPRKTYKRTGLLAYPITWEHQREWLGGLKSGLVFPRPNGEGMFAGGKYYQFIWDKIRRAAGLPDVQYYDLKHHAVAWMRSCGIDDWRIAKAAGWASTEMLADYDPDNRHLIEEYDRQRVGVADSSTICSTAKILGAGIVK